MPLNFKYAWELEEEMGSPHFEDFVKNHLDLLDADSVLVSDTVWLAAGRPSIPYGLRGLVSFEVTLETGSYEVHSGLTGGAARNPLGEIAQIISECYNATTGHVKIPGFYDDVRPATTAELDGFVASGFNLQAFTAAHGLKTLRSTDTKIILSRLMAEPTFEVHGIVGGYTGPSIKNIIPPLATAKISARLVPGQDPQRTFELIKEFIIKHHPDARIHIEDSCRPYLGELDGPYAAAAITATKFAFDATPAFVREGGSIGSVLSMATHLKAPIALLGLGLPEHGYHSINENFDWTQASGGIKLFVKYFSEIAKIRLQ